MSLRNTVKELANSWKPCAVEPDTEQLCWYKQHGEDGAWGNDGQHYVTAWNYSSRQQYLQLEIYLV